MRNLLILLAGGIVAGAMLLACNSQEGAVKKLPPLSQSKSPTPEPQQVHNPADSARRITAEELYKLYQKNSVLIVDTRNDAAFKQSHIKGAILIPSNEVASRINEFPKDKFIATYCT